MPSDEAIRHLLETAKTIAVVGLSSNPLRASYGVSDYLKAKGYRIIPVNPNETEVLGEPAVPDVDHIQGPVDVVNVFRRSEFVPEIVDAAIRKGARCVWMQQDVYHAEAARKAEAAGMLVMMDVCILREYHRLLKR